MLKMPLAACLLLLVAACAGGDKKKDSAVTKPAADAPAAKPAAVQLQELSAEYWQWSLQEGPEYATILGEHAFDDRLQDISDDGRARQTAAEKAFLARAEALDAATLSVQEALTRELLIQTLKESLEAEAFAFHTFDVDQLDGPQSGGFATLMRKHHPRATVKDIQNLVARYNALEPWMTAHLANLKKGMDAGKTAPKVVVQRVLGQLREITEEAPEKSFFMEPAQKLPDAATEEEKKTLTRDIRDAVEGSVLPAFNKMQAFLQDEYLPKAREQPGISAMPGGDAVYTFLIKRHTTRVLTPEQVHQLGLEELDRVEKQMMEIALSQKHKKGQKLSLFTDKIRKDKKNFPKDTAQLLEVYRASLARAEAALPTAFETLPSVGVEVVEMDASRASSAPAAYYEESDLQGSRKAQFVANTWQANTRALFNADALTFHESVPGHHLQVGLAHDLKDIPVFRKTLGYSAFVEGWALYSEKLSDELGLYGSPLSRYGYLGMRAWRATRLVVDTGIHAKGWTRAQTVEFMKEHTSLTAADIENEVDRYIMWPGQALAYMVGALEIDALRKEAETSLGASFDKKKFHSAVLMNGAVPLDILRRNVQAWAAASNPAP